MQIKETRNYEIDFVIDGSTIKFNVTAGSDADAKVKLTQLLQKIIHEMSVGIGAPKLPQNVSPKVPVSRPKNNKK